MAGSSVVRMLGKLCAIPHNITYYAPEMQAFQRRGLPYWHAYLGYRSAPMGRVAPAVVVATFYNFAPSFVGAAIPQIWETTSPTEIMALRDGCVDAALTRALGDRFGDDELGRIAGIMRDGIDGITPVARPLFAAHAALAWPGPPRLQLHHACTLWREHRGDGHNIALAAAGIDGVECHVLLAGQGVAGQRTIERLRGWTADEWHSAVSRLAARGLVDEHGTSTVAGRRLRADIEEHTDRLAAEPVDRLGADRAAELIRLLEPLARHLVDTGAVAGTWPPPPRD